MHKKKKKFGQGWEDMMVWHKIPVLVTTKKNQKKQKNAVLVAAKTSGDGMTSV